MFIFMSALFKPFMMIVIILYIIIHIIIMLSVTMLSIIILCVNYTVPLWLSLCWVFYAGIIMLTITMGYNDVECHNAKSYYAESHNADCNYAEWHYGESLCWVS